MICTALSFTHLGIQGYENSLNAEMYGNVKYTSDLCYNIVINECHVEGN